ncbi:hypothetical protein [Ferrovibrio sp.]|uniref:hypothetical protein n=1 Tax=Ferrovibrio sp. TaxID=1917215 RepID=UPI0035AEEDE1
MNQPSAALQAAIRSLGATARERVFSLEHDGRRLWVKRPGLPRLRSSVLMQRGLALLTGLAMLKPARQSAGQAGLRAEAEALQKLAADGWPVPPVLALTDAWLLLGDAGESVESLLGRENDPAQRRGLIEACADLLSRLHAGGHWHGGAQIRNFSWTDGKPGLLDLEDHDLPGMTQAQRQARDLLLFLYSLTRYDRNAASPLLVPLARQLVQAANAETRAELLRLHRRIGWVIRLAKPFAAKAGRDIRQALAAEAALNAALN